MRIPEYEPFMGKKEIERIKQTVNSGWVSSESDQVSEVEDRLESFLGTDYCFAVDSGTAALHLALESLELSPDAEVVVQDFTYGSTGLAVKQAGFEPVLVDIEADKFSIDPEAFEKAITPETEAVIVAHMFGRPAEMDRLMKIARKNNLKVVEDAALGFGSEYRGDCLGTLGDVGCFSFAWNKTISSAKGGAVVTSDDFIADKIRQMADYGRSGRYVFEVEGYNYSMDGIRASILDAQLERFEDIQSSKKKIFDIYRQSLRDVVELFSPDQRDFVEQAPSNFYVLTDRRESLSSHLSSKGIGTRKFFEPLTEMPLFDGRTKPVARNISKRGLVLPSQPQLEQSEVRWIGESIRDFLG